MIKIKYEVYLNDFVRKNKEQSFSGLGELADWIFDQMEQDYQKDNFVMYFPTPKRVEKFRTDGPSRIEFMPKRGEATIWIHQISSEKGIIFSDGTFTSGQKFWSKSVQQWCEACNERQHKPKFNFVED